MQPIDIDNVFTYHPPVGDQVDRHQAIREGGKTLAHLFDDLMPDGPEKTLAIRKIQEGVMWANAGIACAPYDVGGSLPPGRTEQPYAGGVFGDNVRPC